MKIHEFNALFVWMLLIPSKYEYFKRFLAISSGRHLYIDVILMWFWTKFLDHFLEENAKKVTFPRPSQTKLYMFWNQHEKCYNLSYRLHSRNIYKNDFGFSPYLAVNLHFYFAHISMIVSNWNILMMRHQSAFKTLLFSRPSLVSFWEIGFFTDRAHCEIISIWREYSNTQSCSHLMKPSHFT